MSFQSNRLPQVLLISHDVVGQSMAGPGIRYYHLARVLAHHADVTLAIPNERSASMTPESFTTGSFKIVTYSLGNWASLANYVVKQDVCLLPSVVAFDFPELSQCKTCLVVDGYDPLLPEWLASSRYDKTADQARYWPTQMHVLRQQYLLGDFYICASERQRDWWLGLLEANGRINPDTFNADPSLRNLIDVVPFGLAASTPQHTKPVMKGVWPGLNHDDKILLWGGGLWPWLDPLTAIRAVSKIWLQRQDVKLVFPGTKHPNPQVHGMPTLTEAAQQLADELGLRDKAVFFGDWVPYSDWDNILLESDIALSLHFDTLETRLAFRSRVFDYVRANLPTVATEGDATSELIRHYGIGYCVPYEDADQVAQAILTLLATPKADLADHFSSARQALTWEQGARPLIRFCQQPHRAADRQTDGPHPGHPDYVHLQEQIKAQKALIKAYESGLFMRTMRWLRHLRPSWQTKA